MGELPLMFEVIRGGKDEVPIISEKPNRGGPPGHDWLRDLDIGDRFLSRRNFDTGPLLMCFGVAQVLPEAVLLARIESTGMMSFDYVDSKIFSGMYKMVALLPKPREEGENEQYNPLGPGNGENNDRYE